jgi:hypothetical protein
MDNIVIESHSSKMEIINDRGSSRYCNLSDKADKKLVIDFNATGRSVDIDGIRLSSDQRKTLIKFLKQTDKGH